MLTPLSVETHDIDVGCNMPFKPGFQTGQRDLSPMAMKHAHQREIQAISSRLSEATELQGYYKKMAEDYRSKYLALEREFNYLKHTYDYDAEIAKQEQAKVNQQLSERLTFE